MDTINYSTWYASPDQDPYEGDYTELCAAFSAALAAPAPADMLASVVTTKTAFVTLTAGDGCVHVLHRFHRQITAPGLTPSVHEGHVLATLDDLNLLGPVTVRVPADLFHRSNVFGDIRTPDAIDAELLTAAAATHQLPQAVAGGGDTEEARTRWGTVIPPCYVPLVLAATGQPGGLTPRRLWTEVVGAIRASPGQEAACQSFVDWARIAVSHGVGPLNPIERPDLTIVAPDAAAAKARALILRQDLPHRFIGGTPDLAPVVQALGLMRAETAAAEASRLVREETKLAAAKLPSRRWNAAVQGLLNVCQVDSEDELPELWGQMAQAGPKADRVTIQHQLSTLAVAGGIRVSDTATCGQLLATEMGSLRFITSRDDLKRGLSVFITGHPDQESARAASESAGHYDQLMQGTTGITLADSISLASAQELKLPTKLIQVKRIIYAYHRLLIVALGQDHAVTRTFDAFANRMDTMENHLDLLLDGQVQRCSGILRFVQLKMARWFADQAVTDARLAPPELGRLWDRIEEEDWTPVPLPPAFLQPPARSAPAKATGVPAGGAPVVAPGRVGHFKAPAEALDPTLKPRPNFNMNNHIKAHGEPPKNDRGGTMCLSFHARGRCQHECARGESSGVKNDHRRHSAGETTRLVAYLNLSAPDAAPGGS